ncbi:MAG: tRNA uridine-5-carboxymethylaminomethyl(34) synthesis GTPase MnmE [Gammaproteobacteria bacterium]|jgi:tRNA modification GTPase|nr:tRNA uridine-5-carboxymethylaminomethyl(34) synthesis GTPase MnmE [Chromatiales bacterium]MDP6673888.1 tRNA uridine-5-carboxymethylaminomethyl(34) synthesis GTPase MnmE [Gammaproteobacteria bacterium]
MSAAHNDKVERTIVARATPAGRGGVAVIRISGPAVKAITAGIIGELPQPRFATLCNFLDADDESIDSGIALFFPAPHSFTGEDVLELQGHGGSVVTDMLIARIVQLGARLAEPGEFTRRAFINDKLDLSQAEAVADLIDSSSKAAARAAQRSLQGKFSAAVYALNSKVTELRVHVEAAIDFPEEEINFLDDAALLARLEDVDCEFVQLERTIRIGRLLRDGVHIVLAGRPNAGKSSLLNALAGYDAAIVTDIPGTTRDIVREHIEIDGLPVHIIDTAGLHDSEGVIEQEGIRRTRQQIAAADHALIVIDATDTTIDHGAMLRTELPGDLGFTYIRNKIDLTDESPGMDTAGSDTVNISALTGDGIDALCERIKTVIGYEAEGGEMITARQRHLDSLRQARDHFLAGKTQLLEYAAGELMAEELLQVQNHLAEITGEFSSDDLLGEIFSAFCIGK